MNKKFNKLFAFLLSLAMLISMLPAGAITVSAAENEEIVTVSESTNVAKIGDTEYATLQAAMKACVVGDNTITLLKDSTEVFTFAQKSGVNIVIDGDGHTFSGKITLSAGGGNLTFTDAKIAPANSHTIYLNASTAPNVTFDGCVLQGANKSGAIVYGYASNTSNSVTVKNCTADNLQYIVSSRQTGPSSVLIENVTATNMIYLARTLKCLSVTVKNVTCDAVIGVDIKNDGAGGKLTLEDVNINVITYGGTVYYPVSGSGAGASWTVEVKGENYFTANGVAYEGNTWFSGNDGYKIVITEDAVINPAPAYVAQIGEQGFETLEAALAAANAGDKIVFCEDINENVTINKAVTIDGAGFKYIGKATVAGVADSVDNVNFINVKFVADTTVGNNVIVDLQRYAEATFDGCDFTSNSTDIYYNSYKGIAVANDCTVDIKNCTASKLYYMIHISQSSKNLTVENCTLSDMVYGIGAFKCTNVAVKDFTYSGMASGINVKNSNACTLALENVNISTTMNGRAPVAMWKPDSGNASVKYTITLKGDNVANGAAMTKGNEAAWFARQDESNLYEIKDLNGLAGSGTKADPYQIGSADDLILFRDSVNAGETKYSASGVYVALTADIDLAGINWVGIGSATAEHGFMGNFDGNGFKIKNLTITNPDLDSDGYAYAGLFAVTEGIDKDNQNIIKNLIIENVTISTNGHIVAAAIAYPYYTIVENVTVCGNIDITGGDYTSGVLAYTRRCVNASNLTVFGNAGSTITGRYTVGGVISDIQMNGGLTAVYSGFEVSGVKITGEKNVGGISGIISGQTLNGATVENIELACSDARVGIVSGSMGTHSTIENVTHENVVGATAVIGGTFDTAKPIQAVIGGKYYFATLADAVAAAQNKNVIKLLCDSEGPGIVINKSITIDFNGYNYTLTEKGVGSGNITTNGFQILQGNAVEFKNGTVKVADSAAGEYYILIQNYADLKIRNMKLDGTNLDKWSKTDDSDSYVVSINSGRVYFIGNVEIITNDDGDTACGIDVYDYSEYYDLPIVDIPDTVLIDGMKPADAAKANKIFAVARAGKVYYATLQQAIDNSASFVLVRDVEGSGVIIDKNVNINLGGFTYTVNSGVGSTGTETLGFQILKGNKVGISNGKIAVADSASDKLAILVQNYGDLSITNLELDGTNLDRHAYSYTLSINSGNVKLMGTTNVIANTRGNADDIAIDVYDYSAAGYELPVVSIYSTAKYTEGKLLAAAKYGNYYYASLQQCIDKHGTATLVCDFAGPGVVINKNATINFAGFTYSITEPVGSTGTASNGFQVLAGNRLTMNNGTLKVADSAANKFYILVQNYADLTLSNMTLDGTNLDKYALTDGDSYTLSNNSGNVNINGTSKIIANNDGDKAFAFDVCDKSAWGYELPKVKVAATAAIEGNIEAAAKIGVNYYATLAQAIADRDNASSKDELVLMSNIVLEDTLTISATKAIVLDLNGFTISQTKACTGHYAMIVNKAILTIKDSIGGGKISFTDTGAGDPNFGWGSYTIVNEGKMIVNSGIIENLSAQNANGSAKHMYCAIQQNNTAAQLQINGGTISTPSYRSIRINAGSLTVGAWATTEEGATIEGQVWIQPFADGISVNVNNGKFSPRGVDGSSIYVENSSKAVAFRVNGGEFATKIGCANADALKGAIRGGSFTEDAIANTNAILFHKNFVNK